MWKRDSEKLGELEMWEPLKEKHTERERWGREDEEGEMFSSDCSLSLSLSRSLSVCVCQFLFLTHSWLSINHFCFILYLLPVLLHMLSDHTHPELNARLADCICTWFWNPQHNRCAPTAQPYKPIDIIVSTSRFFKIQFVCTLQHEKFKETIF